MIGRKITDRSCIVGNGAKRLCSEIRLGCGDLTHDHWFSNGGGDVSLHMDSSAVCAVCYAHCRKTVDCDNGDGDVSLHMHSSVVCAVCYAHCRK